MNACKNCWHIVANWDIFRYILLINYWVFSEPLLWRFWNVYVMLGRITTLVLCRQSPLNLYQFRLTRDSKYGLVGTDRNAIWLYFALIRLYLALLFIMSITQKFRRHYWHIAKIFLVHKWCIGFLRLFADVTCSNLFKFFLLTYWWDIYWWLSHYSIQILTCLHGKTFKLKSKYQ